MSKPRRPRKGDRIRLVVDGRDEGEFIYGRCIDLAAELRKIARKGAPFLDRMKAST